MGKVHLWMSCLPSLGTDQPWESQFFQSHQTPQVKASENQGHGLHTEARVPDTCDRGRDDSEKGSKGAQPP